MLCDTVYRLMSTKGAQPDFLELALNAPDVVAELNRRKAGISDSGVNLAQQKLLSMPIPLPPAAEQQRIRDAVDRQWSVARSAEQLVLRDVRRCARVRQAILGWAFEGSLVDQEPADESAAGLLNRIQTARDAAVTTKPKRRMRRGEESTKP